MDIEALYNNYRSLLFSLAYRMLGSVMDAEDIVQEAFLTFEQVSKDNQVHNEKAYLCKIVTNRCLDLIRSSAKQREVYVGTWLPEPLVEEMDQRTNPSQSYLQNESISTAYLLLLQQLNAVERAIFLLREVFEYPYDEISDMVGKSSANCRQIFHRVKNNFHYEPSSQSSFSVSHRQVEQFVQSFFQGNVNRVLELLSDDVIQYTDSGKNVQTIRRPIIGATQLVQIYSILAAKYLEDYSYSFAKVNGNPGVLLTVNNQIAYVYSFEFKDDKIQSIYAVANPDKLRKLNAPLT